jgi:hypothetical protein
LNVIILIRSIMINFISVMKYKITANSVPIWQHL